MNAGMMSTRITRTTTRGAGALLLLLAGAAPLAAQVARTRERVREETPPPSESQERMYQAWAMQLSAQVDSLLRRSYGPPVQQTLRQVDSVLRAENVRELVAS